MSIFFHRRMTVEEVIKKFVPKKKGAQCGRKRRFDSELDARLGLKANHGKWDAMNVYLCPHCEFWHIGHVAREAS